MGLIAELENLGIFNERKPLLVGPNRAAEILGVRSSNMPRFKDRLHVGVVEGSSPVYVKAEVEALAKQRIREKADKERARIEREEERAAKAQIRADLAQQRADKAKAKVEGS